MRPIDGDSLLDKVLRHYTEQEKKGNLSFVACEIKQSFADMVSDAPTVDAVEVVRCKDCKYLNLYDRSCEDCGDAHEKCGVCMYSGNCVMLDGYCSHGERRSE